MSHLIRVLLCLRCCSVLSAVEFYVSPGGSDGNPGTAGEPFGTIRKARAAARTASEGIREDVVIYLHEGWYFQSEVLAFDASDSGRGGHSIIYQAYPGELPVISGGRLRGTR